MNNKNENLSDSQITIQLTAYLDGELNQDETREVEDRLAVDEKYRSKMQNLQKAWDVLDILPASQAKSSFTQSTMKLVVEDAKQFTKSKRSKFWTWAFRGLALTFVPLVASASAYFASQHFQHQPLHQLARDLSIVKDFDVYNCDDNITVEFLEKLADDPSVFGLATPSSDDQRYVNYQDQELNIESIALLNNESKKLLRINNVNFQNLDEKSKSRVRALRETIENHPRPNDLKENLYRYYHWLRVQPSINAAEIRDTADSDERIAKIKNMVNEQLWPSFASQLEIADRDSLYLALMFLVSKPGKENEIRELFLQLYGQNEDVFIDQVLARNYNDNDKKIFANGRRLADIYDADPELISQIVTEADVNFIINSLVSEDAKSNFELARQFTPDASQLLAIWMLTAYDHRFRPKQQDLKDFYNSLPAAEKESLDNELPVDRENRLQAMWDKKYESAR